LGGGGLNPQPPSVRHCCLPLWSTVLPEKLTVPQPVKKFPLFYGTRRFITAFTRSRHLLNQISSVQCLPIPLLEDYVIFPITPRFSKWSHSPGLPTTTLCASLPSPQTCNRLIKTYLNANSRKSAVISGSLSTRQGASSGCGWRNGLQYGG